jgi:hypothetical protein
MLKSVSFRNKAVNIAGHLHLPDAFRETPPGQHPSAKGRFLLSSLDRMLAFSTFDLIPTLLTQPLLLIAGSNADTKIFSEQAYALSNGPGRGSYRALRCS